MRTHNVTAVVIVSNIMLSYHCLRFEYSHNIVLRTKVHKRYTRTDVYAFRIVFSGRRKYMSEGRRRNLDRTTLPLFRRFSLKGKTKRFFFSIWFRNAIELRLPTTDYRRSRKIIRLRRSKFRFVIDARHTLSFAEISREITRSGRVERFFSSPKLPRLN